MKPHYLISTPENVDLHLELAGLGSRIFASLIDTIISYLCLFLLLIFSMIVVLITSLLKIDPQINTFITCVEIGIGIFSATLIIFGYYIFFEGVWQGQTPGKRLAGIRVIEQNGQPVNWPSVIVRNLVRTLDIALSFIGLLVIFLDTNERRLGDLAAGTLVIRERLPNQAPINIKGDPSKISTLDVGRLTPKEYDVLLSYLYRRPNLALSQQPLLAQKLEHYFRARLDQPADGQSADTFLDTVCVAYQARANATTDSI